MKNQLTAKVKSISGSRGVAFAFLIVIGLIQAVMTVLFALSVKILINNAEYNNGVDKIISSAVLLIVCVAVIFILSVIYRLLLAKCQTNVETNIKKKVFSSFIKGDYKTLSNTKTGDLLSRLSSDVHTVSTVHVALIPSLVATVAQLLAIIVALYILQPIFTLLVVGAGVLVFLITYLIRKITAKLHKKVRVKEGEVNNVFSESSQNILTIKGYNAEDYISNKANYELNLLKKFKLNQRYFSSFVTSLNGVMFTAFYVVTVIWGGFSIINGVNGMDFGVVVAMLQLILQIKSPLSSISSYVTAQAEMQVSFERLLEVIPIDNESEKQPLENNNFSKLEFDGVTFSYGDDAVINNSSFTINKGDKVLIKGQSGIGKSTTIKLIMGLYSPSQGKICLDGQDIKRLKGVFSLVPQGNTLFSGSIKSNLIFNANTCSDSDIQTALKIACIDEFISELPNGLDTIVGERGVNLSEGQAQRLAIARSIIAKTPIIVFDEATSALDEKTESLIIENISKLNFVTLIAVSHKTEIQKICNKVLTIENGKILQE